MHSLASEWGAWWRGDSETVCVQNNFNSITQILLNSPLGEGAVRPRTSFLLDALMAIVTLKVSDPKDNEWDLQNDGFKAPTNYVDIYYDDNWPLSLLRKINRRGIFLVLCLFHLQGGWGFLWNIHKNDSLPHRRRHGATTNNDINVHLLVRKVLTAAHGTPGY